VIKVTVFKVFVYTGTTILI